MAQEHDDPQAPPREDSPAEEQPPSPEPQDPSPGYQPPPEEQQQYRPPPPPPGPQPTPPSSPDVTIQQEESELAQSQADEEALEEKNKRSAEKITQMKNAAGELGTTVDAYGKARPGLQQQLQERTDWLDAKRSFIETAVKERRSAVDEAWVAFGKKLQGQETDRANRENALSAARQAHTAAEEAGKKAQETFDELKNRQTALNEALKRLDELRSGIEKAEDENDPVGMYLRLLDFDRERADASRGLQPVEAFRQELTTAWYAYKSVLDQVAQAAQNLALAENAFELADTELKRLQSNRVAEALKLVPPAAGAQPATVPESAAERPVQSS